MYYYILCYGRSKFTRYTVESIIENSKSYPKIVIINNGWNKESVPEEIYILWENLINQMTIEGKIHKIINLTNSPTFALDAFKVADDDCPDEFYFITDNDCIIESYAFDQDMIPKMDQYKLNKLGVDFYRQISISECKKYKKISADLDIYYFNDIENARIVNDDKQRKFCETVGIDEFEIEPGSNITNNATDTTLSIVRKGYFVSQHSSNRISYSMGGLRMLHLGYLESNFNSKNSLEVAEMLLYSRNRYINLTEFKDDYRERYKSYAKLIKEKSFHTYDFFNYLIAKGVDFPKQ